MVAKIMQMAGYRIIPINPVASDPKILNEIVYKTLTDAAKVEKVRILFYFFIFSIFWIKYRCI